MISETQANYGVNIGLHVVILFTFLTIFFFAYAASLEKKNVDKSLKNIIKDQTENFLTQIDNWDKKLSPSSKYPTIKWNNVNNMAGNLILNSQGENPKIEKNNKDLKKFGIGFIILLFIILIIVILYLIFVKKYKIHIGSIIIENLVIFSFVGAIEYFFFTHIATKYIPVTPDFVSTTLLDRIKYKISKELS